MSSLPEISSAPQLNYIASRSQRVANNVGRDYIDAYNQAQMAKYNNEYNYWLWQQQAEYNSPSNQVQRLLDAGLNPNYNSIEGAGNLSSIPSSSGSIAPSIGRNMNQRTSNMISAFNAMLSSVSTGVDTMSKLSDLPPLESLQAYRKTLYGLAKENLKGKELDNFNKMIDGIYNFALYGGDTEPFAVNVPWLTVENGNNPFFVFDSKKSLPYESINRKLRALGLDIDIKDIIKDTKRYYQQNIQPQEGKIAEGRAGAQAFNQVIQKISSGNFSDLSFWQILAAILMVSLSK